MSDLIVNDPSVPKGAEIEVFGLGVFKNGYKYTLTSEQKDRYKLFVPVSDQEDDGHVWPLVIGDESATLSVGSVEQPGPASSTQTEDDKKDED